MMRAAVLMGVAVVVGVAVVAVGVGGEEDWTRHNFATNYRLSPEPRWGTIKNEGMRRSRVWQDTTPSNPFLPPSPRPIPPHQSENNFIMDEDYEYDEDDKDWDTHKFWVPQSSMASLNPRHQHQQEEQQHPDQHSTSLQDLQHLQEEGQVSPGHRPTKVDQVGQEGVPTHLPNVHNKQMNPPHHRGRQVDRFSSSDRLTAHSVDHTKENVQLSVVNRKNFLQQGIMNPDRLSKDVPYKFHGRKGISQPFTAHKQFPEDFISNLPQFPQEFHYPGKFPNELLTADQYSQTAPQHERFPINLFGEGQFASNLRKQDVFTDHQDSQDHMTVPGPFMDHYSLNSFTHQQPFVNQETFGDFQSFPHQKPANGLEDEGRGWLMPSLSGLNMPSSKDIISLFTNPVLTKEDQREACHALNLHTCGTRVIDEFIYERGHHDTCRIREDFLDCMEQQRDLPCILRGERFTRDSTKLIRNRIKFFLWEAQGCILGHSA